MSQNYFTSKIKTSNVIQHKAAVSKLVRLLFSLNF